jgi:hypothetical protein
MQRELKLMQQLRKKEMVKVESQKKMAHKLNQTK